MGSSPISHPIILKRLAFLTFGWAGPALTCLCLPPVLSGHRIGHGRHPGTAHPTTAAAAVVWDAAYRPFGEATVSGPLTFNLRFPGQYYDVETALHYNYFRDYDPTTGRYIQSDPIGLGGGWNTYAYTGGNPVRRMDPKGLEFLDEFGEPILTPPSLRECAARVAAPWFKVRDENKVSDKYIHCMVGGLISQACGKSGGYFAGIGKEFQDWYNDTGVPDWGDAVATFDGENCALGIGGCKGYFQVKLAACCLRKGYKP